MVPAAVCRATYARHRASKAVTDYREFPGRSHLILMEKGWEDVMDYIDGWLADHT
jgi:hypothetical protein